MENNFFSNVSNESIKSKIFILFLISISSLCVMLFIIYKIIINIISLIKNYENNVSNKTKYIGSNSFYISDDYIYNNDNLTDYYKNYNKSIIRNIEIKNNDIINNLKNVTKLKQKLNMDYNINSSINKNILSNNKDDLNYNNKKATSFWSKLLFT
jgi:hypothetical protein